MKKISFFLFLIVCNVSADDAPVHIGTWTPFWRAQPVIGEWLSGKQGFSEIFDYQRRNSFCVQTKNSETEIPFADHLNVVRLIGGWNEGAGSEKPSPADEADLVYKNEQGELQYRWEKLKTRLDPYITAGYTNLTLVLDNIPYCFPADIDMQGYGQVATPADFSEWQTFVSNLCVALVDFYGFETANHFRFRQGTEAQSLNRFSGTQEDYFKIYDYSAAAVKSVLPDAKFGPFNNAGGISTNHNVRIVELAQHCVSGTNYATGAIGSPFDFFAISLYLAQTNQSTRSPAARANDAMTILNTVQAELPVPLEVHEFGILTSESGLNTDEPGARGAAWRFHVMMRLRELGLSRLYHWDMMDTFRSMVPKNILHKLLTGEGWLLTVLDRTAGGEAYVLNTSSPQTSGTEIKAVGVFGGERNWILAGIYNPDRLIHSPETVEIHLPESLLKMNTGDIVLWTSLNQTNSVHWIIRQDLEAEGFLNSAFTAVPEQLASVRLMTTNTTTSPEQNFLGERIDKYQQTIIDSLTLKPFAGTVTTNAGVISFTVTLTPPETAVICIGSDRTPDGIPYAWFDSFGFATNGYSAAGKNDADADGLSNAQEYIAGTDPVDAASVFAPAASISMNSTNAVISFAPVPDRLYSLYSSTDLLSGEWNFVDQKISFNNEITFSDELFRTVFYRIKINLFDE